LTLDEHPRRRVPRLSQTIRREREELMITQAGLAKQLAVNTATVEAWEAGRKVPQLRHVEAMAVLFGIAPHVLSWQRDAVLKARRENRKANGLAGVLTAVLGLLLAA
jgi:DNA-binding XRE family transcriptional regulator